MGAEFDGLIAFINAMRTKLDSVAKDWASNAKAKKDAMKKTYASMKNWKKEMSKTILRPTSNTVIRWRQIQPQNFRSAGQLASNAFLPEDNPWNYLTPETPIPEKNYESDRIAKPCRCIRGK